MAINALPEGYILNKVYKILKILGGDNIGVTYLAEDTELGSKIVIKEFFPQSLVARDQSHYTVSPYGKEDELFVHLLKRFIKEARFLALLRHPNVLKVIHIFEANNTAYSVMYYEEGETLEEYLEHTSKLNEDAILYMMMPILDGTNHLHDNGVLHNDITPDNIYLIQTGMSMRARRPILIGFGAEINAIAIGNQKLSAIVEDGYSPPEHYTPNADQYAATDIYALGAVFYRMITGHKPANASHRQMALLKGEPDPIGDLPTKYKNKYSSNLLKAVTKALDIQQEGRFQSIQEFKKAIIVEEIKIYGDLE